LYPRKIPRGKLLQNSEGSFPEEGVKLCIKLWKEFVQQSSNLALEIAGYINKVKTVPQFVLGQLFLPWGIVGSVIPKRIISAIQVC